MLSNVGSVAGAASLIVVLWTIWFARRHAVSTLRAHLKIMRSWAVGPRGRGWSPEEIRPVDRLLWRCPRWSVVGLYSSPTLVGLGLLTNIVLSRKLAPYLAALTQSVESFNAAVARCEAFRVADIDTMMRVSWKMDRAIESVLGQGVQPDDLLTQDQHDAIIAAAQLTAEETLWSSTLGGLWQSLHVGLIGGAGGRALHERVGALDLVFTALHGPQGEQMGQSKWAFLQPVGVVLSLALSALAIYMSWANRAEDAALAARHQELVAMSLGCRASVYESRRASTDTMMVLESIPASRRAAGEKSIRADDFLEEAALVEGARELNVSLGTRVAAWRLDDKLYAQIRDRHGSRVASAYRVGRLLGFCDERAQLPIVISATGRDYSVGKEFADPGHFRTTRAEVDSLLKVMDCPIRMKWTADGNLWLRLAEGRAVLSGLTDWLAGLDAPKRGRPSVDGHWMFSLLLRRDRGGPKGYSTVVSPVSLVRENALTFEDDFRRVAWLERLPIR